MPYLSCPHCGKTHYSASARVIGARCSQCGEPLIVASDRAPNGAVAVTDVVELQQKISARVHHGGTLADVRREIIEVSTLDEAQRNALWLYAASQPKILRSAKPLVRPVGVP